MRTAFQQQLAALVDELAELCGLAARSMGGATEALLQADLTAAEEVIGRQTELTGRSNRAVDTAITLLALQAPVATDLRAVVSAIHVAADVERMGGLAVHIAKVARRRHPQRAVPDEVAGLFSDMGAVAVGLAHGAQAALRDRDPQLAERVLRDDDAMDELHHRLLTTVMTPDWRHGIAAAVDVALLGRFYERFADHAVQIARRVLFQTTGRHPDAESDSG